MKKTALHYLFVTVAGLATALLPICVCAAPRDLYDADYSSGTIFKFTPNGTKNTFASGLSGPEGLAFDASGNLYETDYNSGTIFKFTPDGTKSTFASGLSNPRGLAFDASGNLFEADGTSNTIFKFTPNGTKSTFASGLSGPAGLAFDASGNLFETDYGSGTIFIFTPDGTKSTFASGLSFPVRLAFDASGNLFEADNGSGTIFKFTPNGTKSTFASGLSGPLGLAFEPTLHQLRNISTRGLVGTGDNVLIGGFILGGNGMVNCALLFRALGPSLTAFGVPGALQDPTLQLFNSSGVVIAFNDNWRDTQQSQIQATGLAPTDDRESAIYATLPAGAYTAIVRGANNTTGVALVEVYNLQSSP